MSKFKKGDPKPENSGRKKGTPNAVTVGKRDWIDAFLDDDRDAFEAEFAALDIAERFKIRLKLLEFVLPKQREIKNDAREPLKIEIVGDASKLTFLA